MTIREDRGSNAASVDEGWTAAAAEPSSSPEHAGEERSARSGNPDAAGEQATAEPVTEGMRSEPAGNDPLSEALRDAVERRGVVMILGATDTGKTTIATALARHALETGRRVAVIDADTGQSEIGPPGAIGLGFPEAGFRRLSDVKPRLLAFIGSVSPPGFLLEWAVGARRLHDRAFERDADLVVVDMPGLVTGPVGERLHLSVAESLRPRTCVLLEREGELRPIARGLPPCRIVRPPVSPRAHAKSAAIRALRRSKRYADYFRDSVEWEMAVDRKVIRGGSLFVGRPLRPEALRMLQQRVGARLHHIESGAEMVRVVASSPPSAEDRSVLSERYEPRRVVWIESGRLFGLLVGLLDRDDDTVAIGSIRRVDFRRRLIRVATPWRDAEAIRGFIWGIARATPDGKEPPPLRRGDL